MTPERWQHVKAVFEEALERAPDERTAFLNQLVDKELRHEVLSLLASHNAAPDFLDAPLSLDILPPDDQETTYAGRRIGAYRLVRELGHGGMGAVYFAERADGQFEQRVAVKFIRHGVSDDALRRRFQAERRILARLNHPHIARLLDGGVSDDGQPYLVMEYVEGTRIDHYCDDRRLATNERLRLFQHVCEAVHYAHQNLVVHRDLKPSNILVTGDGTVKLLDFGIAKFLDDQDEVAPLTRTGMRVMTPEYASPEQLRGEPVTTPSDIYALGIVLYELLTGQRPFRLSGLTPGEAERLVCDQEPARPSTAVTRAAGAATTQPASPETISRMRATQPDKLRRRLAGDLDTIVLKALRKDPARRYRSAEQFSEDIRRHLEGRPVTARPDALTYRIAKFARRHWVGVTATAALVVALLGGIATTTWQARVAAAERDRAQAETAKVEQINAFLQKMLSSASPARDGREVKVVEVLEDATARLDTELADHPEIEADVRRTIGITYQDLGLYDEAEAQLQRALWLRRNHLRATNPATAQSLKDYALVRHWQGALDTAAAYYQQALALFRRMATPQVGFAETLNDYGTLLNDQGAYDEAAAHFEEALAMMRQLHGDEHIDITSALNNLALARHWLGDVDAADSLYHQALAMQFRLVGSDNVDVAHTLNNLAWVYLDKDDPAGADSLFRISLAIRRKKLGDEHPDVALALLNLASQIYFPQGRYATADTLLQEALAICRNAFPDAHTYTANMLYGLGRVQRALGHLRQAETHFREALAMRKHLLGDASPVAAVTELELGECLSAQGRYPEAEAALLSSRASLEAGTHAKAREALERLVDLYEAWGKPENAVPYRALLSESDGPS